MAAGERSWVVDIQHRVKGLNPATEAELWEKQSIYRVPRFLKKLNPEAYKPQVVSFGPYHHGDPRLIPMEEHKQRALLHYLKRAEKPLDDIVSGMGDIVQQLQDSYQDLDETWRSQRDRFLQLMIVDGCFMLEVMRVAIGFRNDYSSNDPIFSNHGMLYNLADIRRDMLMVENQLPLLVLQKLANEPEGDISRLVLHFFGCNKTDVDGLGLHPIDLYRKSQIQIQSVKPSQSPGPCPGIIRSALVRVGICKPTAESCSPFPFPFPFPSHEGQDGNRDGIIRSVLVKVGICKPTAESSSPFPSHEGQDGNRDGIIRSALVKVGICKPTAESSSPFPSHEGQDGNRDGIIRSALELDEAGIRFKKSDTKSLQDITFHGNVLCLPMLDVDDTTEFLFLNLMAFERLHVGAGNEVTSYVFFMDDIIDSAQDVSLLRSKGIIKNDVGSDKALANIFNALSKEAVEIDSDSSNLNKVKRKLNDYCQRKRNRWRANLIRTYFRSPWSFFSLLAAIFLLALTVFQTVYTILSYYYRR